MERQLTKKIIEIEELLDLKCPQAKQELKSKIPNLVFQSLPDSSLFIGDNIDYLSHYAEHCPSVIDLCYIDQPYNTGSQFLYNDHRKSKSGGVFGAHSAWMEFMLPRLVAAREMLKDTGIIAISIDDYEYAHLKILMDNIFGEINFLANIVICRSKNGNSGKKKVSSSHEYLLVYGKSGSAALRGIKESPLSHSKTDEYGCYRIDGLFRKKGAQSLREDRPNLFYPLYFEPDSGRVSVDPIDGWSIALPLDSKGVERRWLWCAETARVRASQLYASKRGIIYVKSYAKADTENRINVNTLWTNTSYFTERGTSEITSLFGAKVFDTPKPIEFISAIIDAMAPPDALIMDFFAGSGVTAHSAARLNTLDSGCRKTILMEDAAIIPKKHVARLHGFKTIAEITQVRLCKVQHEIPTFTFSTTCNSENPLQI